MNIHHRPNSIYSTFLDQTPWQQHATGQSDMQSHHVIQEVQGWTHCTLKAEEGVTQSLCYTRYSRSTIITLINAVHCTVPQRACTGSAGIDQCIHQPLNDQTTCPACLRMNGCIHKGASHRSPEMQTSCIRRQWRHVSSTEEWMGWLELTLKRTHSKTNCTKEWALPELDGTRVMKEWPNW